MLFVEFFCQDIDQDIDQYNQCSEMADLQTQNRKSC